MAKYDIILNIKIDQDVKSCLEKMAEENDMTASAVVREILQQFFKKKNNLNEKQIYYYDHLLNEIINNKHRLNDIDFNARFGTNPSIDTVQKENKVIDSDDLTQQYIIGFLQSQEVHTHYTALKDLLSKSAPSLVTNHDPEDTFEDIEDGLAGKIFTAELPAEGQVEIHFKEEIPVDLKRVIPRQVIKKPTQS
ncbi:hypothetical protein D3C71_1575320 [compost metagenome]